MNETIEARAQELDPGRTKTIGSYVIGKFDVRKGRRWGRVLSER